MDDFTFLVELRFDLPNLFDADSVMLWVFTFIKPKVCDELFSQMPTTTLSKQSVFSMQLHSRHERIFLFSRGTNAHVTRCYPFYRTVVVKQHFGGREARVNLNTIVFRLLREPTTDVAHRNYVVPVVVNRGGQQQVGDLCSRLARRVVIKDVFCHSGIERRTHRVPVGQ